MRHIVASLCLLGASGCMSPEAASLGGDLPTTEYLVNAAKDQTDLGVLYRRRRLDPSASWEPVSLCLFPPVPGVNQVEEVTQSTTRAGLEELRVGGHLDLVAIQVEGSKRRLLKYRVESARYQRLKTATLHFRPQVKAYIEENEKEYEFFYVERIYFGALAIEGYSEEAAGIFGSYAAFNAGGDYYATAKFSRAIDGGVVFGANPIDSGILDSMSAVPLAARDFARGVSELARSDLSETAIQTLLSAMGTAPVEMFTEATGDDPSVSTTEGTTENLSGYVGRLLARTGLGGLSLSADSASGLRVVRDYEVGEISEDVFIMGGTTARLVPVPPNSIVTLLYPEPRKNLLFFVDEKPTVLSSPDSRWLFAVATRSADGEALRLAVLALR